MQISAEHLTRGALCRKGTLWLFHRSAAGIRVTGTGATPEDAKVKCNIDANKIFGLGFEPVQHQDPDSWPSIWRFNDFQALLENARIDVADDGLAGRTMGELCEIAANTVALAAEWGMTMTLHQPETLLLAKPGMAVVNPLFQVVVHRGCPVVHDFGFPREAVKAAVAAAGRIACESGEVAQYVHGEAAIRYSQMGWL